MDLQTIASTAVGVLAGGIISGLVTWFVARFYYIRASKDLEREAQALRKFVDVLIRALEAEGWISVNRDASGDPIGVMIKSGPIELRGGSHVTITGEVLDRGSVAEQRGPGGA